MNSISITENALRKRADREGYVLRKSRARDWRLEDRQGFMLLDASTGFVVVGSNFDADLEDIATYLEVA